MLNQTPLNRPRQTALPHRKRDVAWWRFQLMRKLTAKLSPYAVKDFHFMGVRSPVMIEK
jgi:hypothetical protein